MVVAVVSGRLRLARRGGDDDGGKGGDLRRWHGGLAGDWGVGMGTGVEVGPGDDAVVVAVFATALLDAPALVAGWAAVDC